MADLLDAVGAEAGRLRATMLRMVSERLVTAEEEAARILKDALEEATKTRGDAVRTMTERLKEAEGAAEAIRRTAMEDNRRAKRKALPLLTSAVAQVENLRDEIAGLFDSAEGLVPSLGQAASHVRKLIGDVDALFPEVVGEWASSSAGHSDSPVDSAATPHDNDRESQLAGDREIHHQSATSPSGEAMGPSSWPAAGMPPPASGLGERKEPW
jgi:hypothetical protein